MTIKFSLRTFALLAGLSYGFFCYGQDSLPQRDSILIVPKLNGSNFYIHNKKIKIREALSLMENNDLAYDQMDKARESYIFGNLFCLTGCGLIAYPLLDAIFDNKPKWTMAWSGCAIILVSIPIFNNFNRQSEEAIRIYNSELNSPPVSQPTSSLYFGTTPNGLGFRFNF
jgi:hypothetical protein